MKSLSGPSRPGVACFFPFLSGLPDAARQRSSRPSLVVVRFNDGERS